MAGHSIQLGKHISAAEIQQAFQPILNSLSTRQSRSVRLGFAISGGVDSTALTYLWHQFRLQNPQLKPYVRGFVVDHGLRPGSAEEAQLVASRFEKIIGRSASIITLNWAAHGGIDAVTSIETAARKLRYQALAQAALKHHFECIFLGHHADDVVETTLQRMIMKSQGSGLVGLKRLANIPECSGMYGIDNSGHFRRLESHLKVDQYIGGPETGGIKIARPLLNFSKSRLIATCEDAGLDWVEDGTNQDVTLTQRNALRSVLNDGSLPMALRKHSILQALQNIETNSTRLQELVRKVYDATWIKYLDLRSGIMEVCLPSSSFVKELSQEWSDGNNLVHVLARYLQMLTEAVSPDNVIKLETILPIATALLDELMQTSPDNPKSALSVGRVKIDRLNELKIDGEQHICLKLHRAAFSNNARSRSDIPESVALPSMKHESLSSNYFDGILIEDKFSWDGRWWMSIMNESPVDLRLEALDEEKISYFQRSTPAFNRTDTWKLWKEAATGKAKFTIPAIVCDGPPPEESKIPKETAYTMTRASEQMEPIADQPFEIYKYSGKTPGAKRGEELEVTGKLPTRSVYSLSPSMFDPEDNLSKSPQSERHVRRLPRFWKGQVDASRFPMPKGSFIVAIPTLGLFLNPFWAQCLSWDIRYKKVDLPDMEIITRYRLEKPVMINGVKKGAISPAVVGERFEPSIKKTVIPSSNQ